jgi:hypothetical protein
MFKNKLYYIYTIASLFIISCSSDVITQENTSSSKANISLSPCLPLDSSLLYPNVIMQNYTYSGGKAIFGAQGIRLGTKTPHSIVREFTKTKKGTHVHLNLNNKEHAISNNNTFEYHIPNGKHRLFGFIARSYYESIKNTKAIIAKEIEVKNGALIKSKNLSDVAIIYNAPRGLFKLVDSKKILLDFLLFNTEINNGENSVRITIDQSAIFEINTWQSYYIEGASPGEHTVQLELLDATGKQLTAPAIGKFVITEERPES